ncbi:MAG: flavodoxin [Selenomonadaceae bacterium]|nr:flavodoxin [Selenomonadaceae bacterium]
MSKVAVVYWSGTGNTEAMAQAVQKGAQDGGAEAGLFRVETFSANDIAGYDGILFGCPAMGDEVLEEEAFEPFFAEAESHLKDVPVALFGSYGWGGGAWMEAWAERTKGAGAKLFRKGLAMENAPDDEGIAKCEALGRDFVKSL